MMPALPWGTIRLEMVLGAWIVFMLGLKCVFPRAREYAAWLFGSAGILIGWGVLLASSGSLHTSFQSLFILNGSSVLFKSLFLFVGLATLLLSRAFYRSDAGHLWTQSVLILSAVLGACVVCSANDLLLLFIGMEMVTFSLYIMVAYLSPNKPSVEAGLKYLIMGSVASGCLIYGIAMLYGFAGSTQFEALARALSFGSISLTAFAGFFLILSGIGFKIGIFPFHWWVPDVYEGAPTPTVAFLSVGSKLVGIVALMRILSGIFWPISGWWLHPLAILATITICFGNLVALLQTDFKRLLGYSSISHAGYLLLGLALGSFEGIEAVAYYALAYILSGLAVFTVIIALSLQTESTSLDETNGLAIRSPWLAACLFIGLLSLAGVPPTAGFFGKLLVLLATIRAELIPYAVIGAVNVAVSLYYYLGIIKRVYSLPPKSPDPLQTPALLSVLLAFLCLAIIVVGFLQAPFLEHIQAVFQPLQPL